MATWYALKVQPEREEKIRGLLEQRIRLQGLQESIREIMIPTEKVSEVRNGKKRVVEVKTYPGYLFAEMDLTDDTWYVVTETDGVTGFVDANPRKPQPLPSHEINRILKDMLEQSEAPKPKVEFEIGSTVRIKDGPFQNYEGIVEEVYPAKGLLKVNVHIFGRTTPVELEYFQVEKT